MLAYAGDRVHIRTVIVRKPDQSPRKSTGQSWHRPVRAEPLWTRTGARQFASKVGLKDQPGRFFNADGSTLKREEFGIAGSADVYRLSSPLADREEADRPYEENVWVRAGIKAVSEGYQRLVFTLLDGPVSGEADSIDDHPLITLLNSPNRIMTAAQFWRAHAVNMKHDGENVWFIMDAEGMPIEADPQTGIFLTEPVSVLPVRGQLVELKYDTNGMPMSYRYQTSFTRRSGNTSPEFPAASVLHFTDYDPYNITRGLGDVQSLARETDLYFQAFRAMDGSVRNGGDPGGFIIYDHEVAADEMARRQDVADEEFSGPNQRRIKLLQSSAKFVPNPVKPSDMQYEQLLTWLRDSILSGLGVPPPCVGVYDNATYNNVETAYRELWTGSNGILSLADGSADVITSHLLPRFDRLAPGSSDLYCYFERKHIEVLREDVGEQITRAADISSKGIAVSFNEALKMQGVEVEPADEGDLKFVTGTLTELSDESADDSTGGGGEGETQAGEGVEAPAVEEPDAEDEGQDQASIVPASSVVLEKTAEEKRLDATYKKWRATVNMSASELERWSKNPCSRKASVNPAAVIKRNLHLLRTPKSKWTAKEVRSANRTISFVSRMRGMPRGKPKGDCPSKRDISLKNWAYNPSKGSSSYEPDSELERHAGLAKPSPVVQKRALQWLNSYENAQITQLRRIANGGLRKYSVLDEVQNPEALTDEAWNQLLLNKTEWAGKLEKSVRVALRDVYSNALLEAAGEIDAPVTKMTDPRVIESLAQQRMQLAEGVTSVTARRVKNAIAKTFAGQSPTGNVREMVKQVLPELTEDLRKVFGSNEARAATIAQTETNRARSSAKYTQYEDGNVETIRWKASRDGAVRPTHAAVSGQVVRLGEAFDNGLRYPRDPRGKGSEVINCRCEFIAEDIRDPLDDPDIEIS